MAWGPKVRRRSPLALVDTIGNLGGFAGPSLFGWFEDLTAGDDDTGLSPIADLSALSALVAFAGDAAGTTAPARPRNRTEQRRGPSRSAELPGEVTPGRSAHRARISAAR